MPSTLKYEIAVGCIFFTIFACQPQTTAFLEPFECGNVSVCNAHGIGDQFCSHEAEPRCVLCMDIEYSCFRTTMPFNCTRYCLEMRDKERDRKLKEAPCKSIENIPFGFTTGPEVYIPGDKVDIGCKTGYHLNGSDTLTCLPYGYWSHRIPKCEENRCNTPSIEHGAVIETNTVFKQGSNLTLKCDIGYTATSIEVICMPNGSWSYQKCLKKELLNEPFLGTKLLIVLGFMYICLFVGIFVLVVRCYCKKRRITQESTSLSESSINSIDKTISTHEIGTEDEQTRLISPGTDETEIKQYPLPSSTHTDNSRHDPKAKRSTRIQDDVVNSFVNAIPVPKVKTGDVYVNVSLNGNHTVESVDKSNNEKEPEQRRGFHNDKTPSKSPTQASDASALPLKPFNDETKAGNRNVKKCKKMPGGTQPIDDKHEGKLCIDEKTVALSDINHRLEDQIHLENEITRQIIDTNACHQPPHRPVQPDDATQNGNMVLPKGMIVGSENHAQPSDTRNEEKIAVGTSTIGMGDMRNDY